MANEKEKSNISLDMTEAEYAEYLVRQEKKRYCNDAKKDSAGNTIDGDEYILLGVNILNDILAEA